VRSRIIGVVLVCMGIGLIGCRQDISQEDFLGTWVNQADRGYSWKKITLNLDGTAELTYWNNNTAGPCTWKFKAGKLLVADSANKVLIDLEAKFRGGKTKLVLTGTPKNVVMTGDGTYLRQ
jgi:hypothetical protein